MKEFINAYMNGDGLVFMKNGESLYEVHGKAGLYYRGLSKTGFIKYRGKEYYNRLGQIVIPDEYDLEALNEISDLSDL